MVTQGVFEVDLVLSVVLASCLEGILNIITAATFAARGNSQDQVVKSAHNSAEDVNFCHPPIRVLNLMSGFLVHYRFALKRPDHLY